MAGPRGPVAPPPPDINPVLQTSVTLAGAPAVQRVPLLIEAAVSLAGMVAEDGTAFSAMPSGTVLNDVELTDTLEDGTPQAVIIYLDFPSELIETGEISGFRLNQIGNEFRTALLDEPVSGIFLKIRDPKSGKWLEPNELNPPPPDPKPVREIDTVTELAMAAQGLGREMAQRAVPVINPGQPAGSLSNRTIFINQSHGWFDDYTWSGNRYRVQRGLTCEMVEDFASPEFLNLYVLPFLRNSGAKVMTVRESDLQTKMVIVDNSDTAAGLSNGQYVETGTWASSSLEGFKQKTTAAWTGVDINPFSQGAGQNRLSSSLSRTGTATETAGWTAKIPASGFYNVYASWSPYSGRANDAQYMVYHSGGVTEVRVNQEIDGYTWVLLGNWYFEANGPETERKVVLTNVSSDTTAVNVSADAVRWGGGMGDMARHTNGVSGRPRWEEEAVLYLQYNGFGRSGLAYTGTDDEEGGWGDRPQYARWEHSLKDASVEDAVYLGWHTNATVGGCAATARGLTTYRNSNSSVASTNLQNVMHDKLYVAARDQWFGGSWTVRSKASGNYGENNQDNLGTNLPGILIEALFHDNPEDAYAYNEPGFRYIFARAFTQGLINYFNQRDGTSRIYPPEPPVNFRAEALGGGQVRCSWSAGPTGGFNGAAASSYKVFTSRNGFGFDNGVAVTGTSNVITGVPSTEARYFRVAAVNAGGQSFPTETLAANGGGTQAVLIVNGFDRNQRSLGPLESVPNLGTVRRTDWRNFQAQNYIVEHAEALEQSGVRISSCSNEVVANGTVNLSGYSIVFWMAGEESTTDEALSASEQSRLQTFLSQGRRLFISGSEVGWDLGRSGTSSASDVSFYNSWLRTAYSGDDAGTYTFSGSAGGPFAGLGNMSFATSAGARYDAESPDQIAPSSGSGTALQYVGGTGGNAGVAYTGSGRVISLGFPFEAIATAANRKTVMDRVLLFFAPNNAARADWMIYE